MRLLFIHSKPFTYKTTEPTRFAEEVAGDVRAEGRVEDALVVMFAAEKPDEKTAERAAAKSALEIERVFKASGAATIVLYPYPHLSSNLATPEGSLKVARKLRRALEHMPVLASPFGWNREFQLNATGKPASESSRVVEAEYSEITRSVDRGREHPVRKVAESLRHALLDIGFDEIQLPAIIEEEHIVKQFDVEATLVLESSYTLTGLDRATLELDDDKRAELRKLFPKFDRFDDLDELIKRYAGGGIEPLDLLDDFTALLRIDGAHAVEVMEQVFPEFAEAMSVPVGSVLLSHAASGWFPVLQRAAGLSAPPVRMFSIASRYRRERVQDAFHLPESTSGSAVVMDRRMNLDDCKKIALDMLYRIGIEKCSFRKKRAWAYCFEPDSETEIFVSHRGEELEIGNIGLLSKNVLESYGVPHPACIVDLGVERIALVLTGADDMHTLVFPMLHSRPAFTDTDIAGMLKPAASPASPELVRAAKNMANIAVEHKDDIGPAEVTLYKGEAAGRAAEVKIFNWDAGKQLLSLAAMNEIYIFNGNIYGLPKDRSALGDKYAEIYESGVNSGRRFVDLVIEGFMAEAERRVTASTGPGRYEEQWKITKRPQHINLEISPEALDFIQRGQKTVKIGGPLFFGLRIEWK